MQLILQKCDPVDICWLDDYLDISDLEVFPEAESLPHDYRGLVLRCDGDGLSIRAAADPKVSPTRVDFLNPRLAYRLGTSRRSEGLPKAVGLDKSCDPVSVLDATAGMGVDAWILASMGCRVHMLEKSGVMAALVMDGLRRARAEANGEELLILDRLSLEKADARQWLACLEADAACPDVITLDPMFPPRNKSARVKKDMALMQQLLPADDDIDALLDIACGCARKRVVLKRPGKPEKHPNPKPDFLVPGKSCHFQVFLTA